MAARDLTVTLGGRRILAGVSLDVGAGEWVGIIGPNGAGKSTLLRALAGLVPASGEVLLDGRDATTMRPRDRARCVAIVSQRPLLPDAMTVAEYVLLGRAPYVSYFGSEARADVEAVAAALARLDISAFAERPLGTLSGGEQQRAVLARALAQAAPTLLLDEGTSALDVGAQQQVLEIVSELRAEQRLTVLSAMHDLTLAGQFTDRVALLSRGEIVADGSPSEVITADRVRAHYGAEVRVTHGPDGLIVSPVRSRRPSEVRS
ncbi:MAG: ABC transporter ATP-binding protein [Actinomycetota bacterium]